MILFVRIEQAISKPTNTDCRNTLFICGFQQHQPVHDGWAPADTVRRVKNPDKSNPKRGQVLPFASLQLSQFFNIRLTLETDKPTSRAMELRV